MPLGAGSKVTIVGLVARPDLNGLGGTVQRKQEGEDGRWLVRISADQIVSVKVQNLVLSNVPPAGPSLAQSQEDVVRGCEQLQSEASRNSHLPSYSGPARDCLHGGPRPGDVGPFLAALTGCMQTIISAHRRSQVLFPADPARMAHSEIDMLFRYWSRPELASLIKPGVNKVAFSCAVDATVDGDFPVARIFVRSGAFVREWERHGGAKLLSDFEFAADPDDYAETRRCLKETSTDRGLKLYLAAQLPCRCLADLATAAQEEEEHDLCSVCRRQLPLSMIKRCGGCTTLYCGVVCQKADWKARHKAACKGITSRESLSTAES